MKNTPPGPSVHDERIAPVLRTLGLAVDAEGHVTDPLAGPLGVVAVATNVRL